MSFDALKFLRDFRVPYATEGNKHCRPGWVQVHCPFCAGSQDYHLGYNIRDDFWNCWRCKGKSPAKVVQALARCGREEAYRLLEQYRGRPTKKRERNPIQVDIRKQCKLPPGTGPMNERHKRYLERRLFYPDDLEEVYGLKGTGPVGLYSHRIVIPIVYHGKIVSYQARDITGKSDLPYRACPMEEEALHHKHTLYALDLVGGDSCAVVEGVADAWRLGPDAVGTFGTGYTTPQANLIIKRFKRVFIVFDPEPIAQSVARDLAYVIGNAGREAVLVELGEEDGEDPGDMDQDDADALMRDMGLRGWN